MSFIDRTLNRLGFERMKNVPLVSSIRGGSTGNTMPVLGGDRKPITKKEAMSFYEGWTYTAINAIAEEVASVPLSVMRVDGNGDEEEVQDSDLLTLIEGANKHQTGYELRFNTAVHLYLTGNAYWLLLDENGEAVSNEEQVPEQIFALEPSRVKTLRGDIPEFITGYEYRVGNRKVEYAPEQVIHIKIPDPQDPHEGVGPVQKIYKWLLTQGFSEKFMHDFFKNGAHVSTILKSDRPINTEQMEVMRQQFKQLYGSNEFFDVAALPHGVDVADKVGQNPKEVGFEQIQNHLRDLILSGLRVPKTLLGTAESDTNRATAETAAFVFAKYVIKPRVRQIVNHLNEFLTPRFGDDIFITFEDPVPENREQRISEMETAVGGLPVSTVNEARSEYLGLPPVENGDSVLAPMKFTQDLGEPQERAVKPQTNGKPRTKTQASRNFKKRKELSETIAEAGKSAIKEALKEKNGIADMEDDEFEEKVWKQFAERVENFQGALEDEMKDFNARQKKVVLENLTDATKGVQKDVDKADLFKKNDWDDLLVEITLPIQRELFENEMQQAAELIGTEMDDIPQESRKALDDSVELMANKYNEETREQLKETLDEGLRNGESFDQLENRVGEIYEFSDDVRAERVARTETFRAGNKATTEAWRQSGVVKTRKWFTAADDRVCPYCRPMHGKVVDVNKNFFNKGDEWLGEANTPIKLDYADIGEPPLHPMCRCYQRPEQISIT